VTLRIGFLGSTHLGNTLSKASRLRGFHTQFQCDETCDLMMVAPDVEDHDDLSSVRTYMNAAVDLLPARLPVVLVSQVPPGFIRPYSRRRSNLFYQVDTIIMNRALERATMPERFVVGCARPHDNLHPDYYTYLTAFNCPIVKMSYESAELSKLAINYYLAKQIETTNALAAVARHVGADWDEMAPGLRLDARIGPHAYIRPGEPGGHLPRDIRTVERLLGEARCLTP
jgi:UDPglucose 6-dehydrogenase